MKATFDGLLDRPETAARRPILLIEGVVAFVCACGVLFLTIARDDAGNPLLLSSFTNFTTSGVLAGAVLASYRLSARLFVVALAPAFLAFLCLPASVQWRTLASIELFAVLAMATQLYLSFAQFDGDRVTRWRVALLGFSMSVATLLSAGVVTSHGFLVDYDAVLLNFDQHLGIRFPVLVKNLFRACPSLGFISNTMYLETPLLFALLDWTSGAGRSGLSWSARFLISAAVGSLLYHLVPVEGPLTLDADYMNHLWSTSSFLPFGSQKVLLTLPTNCMPSLHTTWAIFIALAARRAENLYWRWFLYLASVSIVLSALTLGQHWFLDLVVAVPFAYSLHVAFEVRRSEWAPAAACASLALGWLLALRTVDLVNLTTLDAWLLTILTIASPFAAKAICSGKKFPSEGGRLLAWAESVKLRGAVPKPKIRM